MQRPRVAFGSIVRSVLQSHVSSPPSSSEQGIGAYSQLHFASFRRMGATAAVTPDEAAKLAPFDVSLEVTGNPRGLQVRYVLESCTWNHIPSIATFLFSAILKQENRPGLPASWKAKVERVL